jgi:hypothetical protein
MKALLCSALLSTVFASGVFVGREPVPAPPGPLVMTLGDGSTRQIVDDSREGELQEAQDYADAWGEAVAVTQDGRLIALFNPRHK